MRACGAGRIESPMKALLNRRTGSAGACSSATLMVSNARARSPGAARW
jgi:hypothetical protein